MRMCVFLLLGACTAAPTPAPMENEMQTVEQQLVPVWKEGDTWTVRYRARVSSIVKALDPPPAFEDSEWIYTVDDRSALAVHISARRDDETWGLTFAPNGRLLSVRDPWYPEPVEVAADAPVFELDSPARRVGVEAWPRFPLDEDFGSDDSGQRQRSHPAGSELEVTLVRAGYDPAAGDVVRTATQRWQAGRPWWSILRIEAAYSDGTTTTLQLEGEVIAWPASTP